MSFENTILSAIIIATVLEVVRFFARRITKRYDLTQEYLMEIVRRRLDRYEDIYKFLRSEIYKIDQNIPANISKAEWEILEDQIFELNQKLNANSLFLSNKIRSKIEIICQHQFVMLGRPTAEDLTKYFSNFDELSSLMRKEIVEGKIESGWVE